MKWRKKPVIVEASQYKLGMEDGFTIESHMNIPIVDLVCFTSIEINSIIPNSRFYPFIKTMEGFMFITKGDYIITGVEGERYPCKENIFLKTYEPAESQSGEGDAVDFTDWADDNYYKRNGFWYLYKFDYDYQLDREGETYVKNQGLTTAQLYQLFLQSNK